MLNKLITTLIIFLCILFFACNSEELASSLSIEPNDILGDWNLSEVMINGVDGTEYNPSITSHFLRFEEDGTFYRTYVIGTWQLDGKTIHTVYEDNPYWQMNIEHLTVDSLVLNLELTDSDYGYGFEEFATDEILNIKETYLQAN